MARLTKAQRSHPSGLIIGGIVLVLKYVRQGRFENAKGCAWIVTHAIAQVHHYFDPWAGLGWELARQVKLESES